MTILELLTKVRNRIDKPQKWVSFWSMTDDGRRLGIDGAIWAEAGHGTELAEQAFHELAKHSGINPMWKDYERVTYLDRHKDVMLMLDKAIESLEAK